MQQISILGNGFKKTISKTISIVFFGRYSLFYKRLDKRGLIRYNSSGKCKVFFLTQQGAASMEKKMQVSLLLDFYGQLLSESGREMTDYYYNDDLSLAEIAEQTGITRQGVRDRIKRCEKQLFSFEEKLGLLKRFQQLEDGLTQISAAAKTIYSSSDDPDVKRIARSIEQNADSLKE